MKALDDQEESIFTMCALEAACTMFERILVSEDEVEAEIKRLHKSHFSADFEASYASLYPYIQMTMMLQYFGSLVTARCRAQWQKEIENAKLSNERTAR